MSSSVQAIGSAREPLALLQNFLHLSKPGVSRLVMITMLCGGLIAPGPVLSLEFFAAVFGTTLVVAGANALNMLIERETDALMQRTAGRPLPAGRITSELALGFGLTVSFTGLALLFFVVNWVAAGLAALALTSYVLVYTPLKRVSSIALWVGAVPGAIPPMIGWAAVNGNVETPALLLFAILFVWQLPHFLAIAVFRCSDYERAGLKVLPAVRGLVVTKWAIVGNSLLLLIVSLLPVVTQMAGLLYGVLAFASGVAFLGYSIRGLRKDAGVAWARRLFLASMPHLLLIYTALVASAV